jgi:hypothetical protein
MKLFESCSEQSNGSLEAVIECLANDVESRRRDNEISANEVYTWLQILCGALVFFMQAGFAMVCAGAVRKVRLPGRR